MMEKFRTHAGRLFLVTAGILLTTTVGHAAARMMASQMALGSSTFAFQAAIAIGALLIAAHVIAFYRWRPVQAAAGNRDESVRAAPTPAPHMREAAGLSAPQLSQLRLPVGLRLDSHEAFMITSASADRKILFVNPAFARLTGFAASEWLGRSGDLLQAEGPLRMESLLWLDTETDGSEAHWIARMHRNDGTPFCAEAHLHQMASRNGGLGHVVVVVTDVTSRVGAGKTRGTAESTGTFETRRTA